MMIFLIIVSASASDCNSFQSPIDIVSPFTYLDPEIEFYLGYQENALLYHDGFNLRIDGDFGGLTWKNSYFWASELLFKQPSEHTLKGKSLPMEMQVFFRDQNSNLLVISALFVNSSESTFLNEIGFGNPQLKDAERGSIFKISYSVDIASVLGYPEHYLYYTGSTSISPCEGNTTWIILTSTYKASAVQLFNFPSSLYGKIRNYQPLNGRPIFSNFQRIGSNDRNDYGSIESESLIASISSGQSFKEVNDDFIVEAESYLDDFPKVSSIYSRIK